MYEEICLLFQIDLIKRLADQYSSHLQLAQTAQGAFHLLFRNYETLILNINIIPLKSF